MQRDLVDAGIASAGLLDNLVLYRAVMTKDIQRQWFGAAVDLTNDLIQIAVFDDWQQRAENLLLHNCRRIVHALEERRFDQAPFANSVAAS